jgi:hypothetical protein
MPFDGATLVNSPRTFLQAAALASGLNPIASSELERHKAKQLEEHPPGWFYRHSTGIQRMQMALLMAAPVMIGFLLELDLKSLGTALAGLLVVTAMAPAFVRVKGPAEWKERLEPSLRDVPPSIRAKAFLLKREAPELRFLVGELFQQQTKLDPYLVAEYQGEHLVLGIWDGETVISTA